MRQAVIKGGEGRHGGERRRRSSASANAEKRKSTLGGSRTDAGQDGARVATQAGPLGPVTTTSGPSLTTPGRESARPRPSRSVSAGNGHWLVRSAKIVMAIPLIPQQYGMGRRQQRPVRQAGRPR